MKARPEARPAGFDVPGRDFGPGHISGRRRPQWHAHDLKIPVDALQTGCLAVEDGRSARGMTHHTMRLSFCEVPFSAKPHVIP
jgi:hypothetical protein